MEVPGTVKCSTKWSLVESSAETEPQQTIHVQHMPHMFQAHDFPQGILGAVVFPSQR